jgi:hypothetical protein
MNMHIFDRIVQARRDFGRKFFREILIVACWALWKHKNEVIVDDINLSREVEIHLQGGTPTSSY